MVLGNQAGGNDLTVAFASTSSVSVDIGGQTATFAVSDFTDDFTTIVASVQEFNGNTVVCMSLKHELDYSDCQTLTGVTFDGAANHDITLGGADQVINNIKFYESPISIGAMDAFYVSTCTDTITGQNCPFCENDGSGASTGTCIANCLPNEYADAGACTIC